MAEERDKQGRFASGWRGGPGRPKAKTEEKFLRALQRAVKISDWKHIIFTAIARAKSGDAKARQWLSDYLIGKPEQMVRVEGIGDLNIALEWADEVDHNVTEAS